MHDKYVLADKNLTKGPSQQSLATCKGWNHWVKHKLGWKTNWRYWTVRTQHKCTPRACTRTRSLQNSRTHMKETWPWLCWGQLVWRTMASKFGHPRTVIHSTEPRVTSAMVWSGCSKSTGRYHTRSTFQKLHHTLRPWVGNWRWQPTCPNMQLIMNGMGIGWPGRNFMTARVSKIWCKSLRNWLCVHPKAPWRERPRGRTAHRESGTWVWAMAFFFFFPSHLVGRMKVHWYKAVLLGSFQAPTVFILASLQMCLR